MTRRRLFFGTITAAAALILLLTAAAAIWLATADLRPFAERQGAAALGRPLAIGTLEISWGDPLEVVLRDVAVANAPWGREPHMARIDRVAATLDPWALLHGRLRLLSLQLDRPLLLLERNEHGVGNWKPPAAPRREEAGGSGTDDPGRERASLPLVLDLALRDGHLVMYTTGGNRLTVDVAAAIRTAGEDQPISLTADGAYNGAAIRVAVTGEAFAVLRDPARPYGIDGTATAAAARIALVGSLADPLDFDGIDGRLEIATEDLDGLGKLFGAELPDRLPLTAKGHLLRRGDDWRLETGTGAIAGAAYEGTFALAEGTGREANAFRIALSLDDLNLDRLVRSPRPASTPPSRAAAEPRRDWRDWRLPAPTEQDDRVEAAVKARRVTLGGLLLQDLSLHLSTAPGRVALAPVSASLLGGRVEGSVTATAEGPRRRLAVALASGGLDAEQVLRLTPANGRPLAGHLDLRADLAGTGAKLGDAVATARGHLVAAMTGGQVSRSLFRAAATDLAALFDEARGRLPLACLLAVAEVRDGVATIAPFRLRTSEGTLFAGGRADLPRNTVDATIRTERTGFLALDVPLHVTGRLDSPTVSPVIASAADAWKAQAASVLDRLPPALGKRVAENGCVR